MWYFVYLKKKIYSNHSKIFFLRFGEDFHYPPDSLEEPHNILLIGGGVGINPLLSIWLQARLVKLFILLLLYLFIH